MTQTLVPYLIFDGLCKVALEFYEKVFSGNITNMQFFKDAPIETPKDSENRVFDAELQADQIIIKASDSFPGQQATIGSNISLFVSCDSRKTQQLIYDQLSENAKSITFPLNENSGFAMLTDKFSISWMLAYHG